MIGSLIGLIIGVLTVLYTSEKELAFDPKATGFFLMAFPALIALAYVLIYSLILPALHRADEAPRIGHLGGRGQCGVGAGLARPCRILRGQRGGGATVRNLAWGVEAPWGGRGHPGAGLHRHAFDQREIGRAHV